MVSKKTKVTREYNKNTNNNLFDFLEQDTVRHEFDLCATSGVLVVSDVIADEIIGFTAQFVRYSLRHGHGSHSPRFCDADFHAVLRVPGFVEKLGDLCRFAAAGGTRQNYHVMLIHSFHDCCFLAENR